MNRDPYRKTAGSGLKIHQAVQVLRVSRREPNGLMLKHSVESTLSRRRDKRQPGACGIANYLSAGIH